MLERKYINDYGILRDYNGHGFKLISLACYRQSGFEDSERKYTPKLCAGNEEKLQNNLVRARSTIYELALCNEWQWFVTLTLDKQKYNRYDLAKYIKDFGQFIRDYKKKTNNAVKYLLVPEHHKDGAWHLHGLIMGLPTECLHEFTLSEKLPKRIRERIASGKEVYTFTEYARKFGYSVFETIENHNAISRYITKYISKESMTTITELNAHSYYCSKGLYRSEVIHQDIMAFGFAKGEADFENEHCSGKWYDDLEEAMEHFEWRVE